MRTSAGMMTSTAPSALMPAAASFCFSAARFATSSSIDTGALAFTAMRTILIPVAAIIPTPLRICTRSSMMMVARRLFVAAPAPSPLLPGGLRRWHRRHCYRHLAAATLSIPGVRGQRCACHGCSNSRRPRPSWCWHHCLPVRRSDRVRDVCVLRCAPVCACTVLVCYCAVCVRRAMRQLLSSVDSGRL